MTYREQIRHPKWISRSNQIKEEMGWKCEECAKEQGREGAELTVHHIYYISGLMMWEHPRCVMKCLCWPCHQERQEVERIVFTNIADVIQRMTLEELKAQPIYAFFAPGATLTK